MMERERIHLADVITSFVDGTCGPCDWDDFVMPKQKDPDLQFVCDYCNCTRGLYPTEQGWCSDRGEQMLRNLAELLRSPMAFEGIRAFIGTEYASITPGTEILKKLGTPPIP